ncbi:MAG: SDR family oxidoreductase [Achromobacter marplatensis]|jgi:NADP-dependent 3-hydroxy acid dehydrogenase YdfG|uniref:SDR family oxidoreductase n=1 Tax=Achromobacter marplatensis TaxID=470868 RepID=UPI003D07B08A
MTEAIPSVATRALSGKVAIVTGASSGIGLALARKLAQLGVKLVLHGRRESRLKSLASEYAGIEWIAGDLTDDDATSRLLARALSCFGRVDFAVNNAGVNHTGTIEQIDIDQVCAMSRINVEAAYRFTYTLLKYFRIQEHGHLIHTTSIMGHKVRETAGAYAGTKHAIEALCESLRIELARSRIKVSCVAPGLVETELHRDAAVRPAVARNIARPLQPGDVAEMILWLMLQPAHVNVPQLVVLPQDHPI